MKQHKNSQLVLLPVSLASQKKLRTLVNCGPTHEFTGFKANHNGFPPVYILAPVGMMDDVETLVGVSQCLMPYARGDR